MHKVSHLAVLSLCFTAFLTLSPCMVHAEQAAQTDQEYTSEQIRETSAETFLERMQQAEPGYQKFAAMHALARKAKESNPNDRRAILDLVTTAMNDKSRNQYQRFQCCYVISECGDEKWVPALVDVLRNDPSVTMRSVAAEALGSFNNCLAAQDALQQAAQDEKDQSVLDVINRRLNQGNAEYTLEQIKSTSVEVFLERMQQPEVGYGKWAALHALGIKAKESNSKDRRSILNTVVAAMNDNSRTEYQRFQCCYVISDCGDVNWVPSLIDVLMKDPSAVMRSVAAEALGKFPNSEKAHSALVRAADKEKDQRVLDVLNRVLGRTNSPSK